MAKAIRLAVSELSPRDAARGLARLDLEDMRILGVNTGDVILLKGKAGSTVARAMPAQKDLRGKGTVLIDGQGRKNCCRAPGERVDVSPVQVSRAREIVLLPIITGSYPLEKARIIKALHAIPLLTGNNVKINIIGLISQEFRVVKTDPTGPVLVGSSTKLILEKNKGDLNPDTYNTIRYEDIGGMTQEIQKIREMIEYPMKYPAVFRHLGIEPPKGLLLHGPPGTGKTLIARSVASETNLNFIHINGPEIMHKYYGESEANLRAVFSQASRQSPSIVFIDEIDAIAPKRGEVKGEVEKRVVAQLLTLMDGLKSRGQVIVIGATNLPDSLDPALRRPGRFDRELEIRVPSDQGRREILNIHTRGMPLDSGVDLGAVSGLTGGFVGADLQSLCREAAMNCLKRTFLHNLSEGKAVTSEDFSSIKVNMEDFLRALKDIQPSATREFSVEVPRVSWNDVGGLQEVKQELKETVLWPLEYGELFATAGLEPITGILLYGPPGTGKTMLAKALANEAGVNFISVKGPALLSKWVGESEKALRDIFKRARQVSPCIVFFDEIDALVSTRVSGDQVRERLLSQLLTELDGVETLQGVIVVAATNRDDLIDAALLRPGRLDLHLRITLPTFEERVEIIKVHTRSLTVEEDVDFLRLARKTEGFSGADIAYISRRASQLAFRQAIKSCCSGEPDPTQLRILTSHFESSLNELLDRKDDH